MFEIVNKFYKNSKSDLFQDILDFYDKNWSVIINYLYGANIVKQNLLWDWNFINTNSWNLNFKQILLDSDFLLPDGAAVRSMYKVWKILGRFDGPSMIPNLNGTDFLPYFIDNIVLHKWCNNIFVHYLTVYDNNIGNTQWNLLNKCKTHIQSRFWIDKSHIFWYEIEYSDKDYQSRSWWDRVLDIVENNPASYHLFLNFRGTPHQEIRTYINKGHIKTNKLLVFNQWWTVDFRVGKEKRAPLIVRKLRLESIRRLFQYPKKNWKKFLISFKMIWLIIKKVILLHK